MTDINAENTNTKNTIKESTVNVEGDLHIGDIINIKEVVASGLNRKITDSRLSEIKKAIMMDDLQKAFQLFLDHPAIHENNFQNQVIMLVQKWNSINKERRQELVSSDEFNTRISRLIISFLELIEKLDDIIKVPPPLPDVIRTFKLGLNESVSLLIDAQNRLWAYDQEQIKIFHLDEKEPLSRITLLKKQWKNFFSFADANKLIASDWEGNLFSFSENPNESSSFLGKSNFENLPIHILKPLDKNRFIAAAWDGKVIIFEKQQNVNGYRTRKLIQIPHLPKKLVVINPEEEGSFHVVVIDQSNRALLLDEKGQVVNSWQFEQPVIGVWCFRQNKKSYLVFLTESKVTRVLFNAPQSSMESIPLANNVVAFSHRRKDLRTAVALKGGVICWLKWNPFIIVAGDSTKLETEIAQVEAIYDPEQPAVLLALGLTSTGNLFTIQDRKVEVFKKSKIDQIILDNENRFFIQLIDREAQLKRIPIIKTRYFLVDCELAERVIVKGSFNEITIKVKNSGNYNIPFLKARIQESKGIPASLEIRNSSENLSPQESTDLLCSVKAVELGALAIHIIIDIFDEVKELVGSKSFNLPIKVQTN